MSENLYQRLLKVEKQVANIRKQLQTQRRLTLKDKLRIHDRAQNLQREYEEWYQRTYVRLDDNEQKQIQTILKSLVELVDNALGTQP